MSDDSRKFTEDSEIFSDSEEDMHNYKGWYVKEDNNVKFFRDLVPGTVGRLKTMVFSTTDLGALKENEKNLREKEEGEYFRCKLESPDFYSQITSAMTSYLADNKLRITCYPWSTQLNELMNNSVLAYAPKTKNFGGTLSLKTQVGIAAAVMLLGYYDFWSRVFHELGLDTNDAFKVSLLAHDKKKS